MDVDKVAVVSALMYNTEDNHNKFYRITIINQYVITHWGRIGTNGQGKVKANASYMYSRILAEHTWGEKRDNDYIPAGLSLHGFIKVEDWAAVMQPQLTGRREALSSMAIDINASGVPVRGGRWSVPPGADWDTNSELPSIVALYNDLTKVAGL